MNALFTQMCTRGNIINIFQAENIFAFSMNSLYFCCCCFYFFDVIVDLPICNLLNDKILLQLECDCIKVLRKKNFGHFNWHGNFRCEFLFSIYLFCWNEVHFVGILTPRKTVNANNAFFCFCLLEILFNEYICQQIHWKIEKSSCWDK